MPPLGFPRRSLFWIMLFFGLLFALPVLPLVATFTFVIEPRCSGTICSHTRRVPRPRASPAQRLRLCGCTRQLPVGTVFSSPNATPKPRTAELSVFASLLRH